MRTERIGLFVLVAGLASAGASVSAQPVNLNRSGLVYVIGTVLRVTPSATVIDLGEAQTLTELERLAVFRPIHGCYEAAGLVTVTQTFATSSICESRIPLQQNDLVMTVRELGQLRPGSTHRTRVLSRQIIRTAGRDYFSTVKNVETALALLDYEQQFGDWERSQATVAGTLLSGALRSRRSDRQDRLLSQIDLVRRLYQRGTRTIPAAGPAWQQVIEVLAGRTVSAGHAALAEADDPDEPGVMVTAQDVRARVLDEIFDRYPEQQNAIALIVAALAEFDTGNAQIFLTTSLRSTQFPLLADDEQLLDDMRAIVRALGNSP